MHTARTAALEGKRLHQGSNLHPLPCAFTRCANNDVMPRWHHNFASTTAATCGMPRLLAAAHGLLAASRGLLAASHGLPASARGPLASSPLFTTPRGICYNFGVAVRNMNNRAEVESVPPSLALVIRYVNCNLAGRKRADHPRTNHLLPTHCLPLRRGELFDTLLKLLYLVL
jgi:hypothetical protein